MNTKEVLKKIKNNTISTDELKKFSKDKQVIIAAVKKMERILNSQTNN